MTRHSTRDQDSERNSKENVEHVESKDTRPPIADQDKTNSKESVITAVNRDTRCLNAERRNETKEATMKEATMMQPTQTAKK